MARRDHHVAEEATEDDQAPRTGEYAELMSRCFAEFFRVLKPGRWMTVEFSNHSNDVWLGSRTRSPPPGSSSLIPGSSTRKQLSYRQVTAEHAVKHDLVISAYKPRRQPSSTFARQRGADGAWAFVREHLSRIPATEGARGQALVVRERQADRIYDRMVGYHVARNIAVPMTAAEFYTGLEQRFPVRDAMYFLPEQVEAYERFRITFKELAPRSCSSAANPPQCSGSASCSRTGPGPLRTSNRCSCASRSRAWPPGKSCPTCVRCWRQNFVSDDSGPLRGP